MTSHRTSRTAEHEHLRKIIEDKDDRILKLRESLVSAWSERDAVAPPMSQGTDFDARRVEAENLVAALADELAGTKAALTSEKDAYRRREAQIFEANGQNRSLESQRQTAIEAVMGIVAKAQALQDKITNDKELSVFEQNELYHTTLEKIALQGRKFLHKAKYAMDSEPKGPQIWAQLTASLDQHPEPARKAGHPEDPLSSAATQGDKTVVGSEATNASSPAQPRAAKRKRTTVISPQSELESMTASQAKAVQEPKLVHKEGICSAPAIQSTTNRNFPQDFHRPGAFQLQTQVTPGQRKLESQALQTSSRDRKPAFESSKMFQQYGTIFKSTAKEPTPDTKSGKSNEELIEEGRKKREAAILANDPPPPSLFADIINRKARKPAPVVEESEESEESDEVDLYGVSDDGKSKKDSVLK